MELLTNIVFFAILSLFLSFLISKFISFTIPQTTTTTNQLNQLRYESKVQFQLPTNIKTDHNKEEVKEETKPESNAVELSLTPDIIAVEADLHDSVAEQRKSDRDSVEKISVEKLSVVEEERDVILDNWELIERSELEKEFMAATEIVVGNDSKCVGNDVEMELYGLHKVATEGPCSQPQPMLFARAKWELEQEKESRSQDHSPLTEAGLENNNAEGDALKVSDGAHSSFLKRR